MEENVIQIYEGRLVNVDVSVKNVIEKDYIWNPSKCSCEGGKYLASIMDDSANMCDEIIESYNEEKKTILSNFNEKKATCNCYLINY